ncbi:hypothetical protein JCM1841_006691 [Sporobolomyces salmonicolor]
MRHRRFDNAVGVLALPSYAPPSNPSSIAYTSALPFALLLTQRLLSAIQHLVLPLEPLVDQLGGVLPTQLVFLELAARELRKSPLWFLGHHRRHRLHHLLRGPRRERYRLPPLRAPLRFTFRSERTDITQARAAEIGTMFRQGDSQLPPPVSPKSVYRLAHFLQDADLVQLALDNFKSQLGPANVAYELYSGVACSYEAIRDVVLEIVVDNWKEVSQAQGTGELEQNAGARTCMLLAQKRMEKDGKP